MPLEHLLTFPFLVSYHISYSFS